MTFHPLVSRDAAVIDDSRIEQLRSACRGSLICAADANYDSARRIWNANIDRRPG